MRRKRAAIVLGMSCILMASAVLQGCQQNPKSGKVEIELVQYKPEAVDIFGQLEKEFNETHDDIHLKISSPNDATTILKTRFIREDYPDIIGIHRHEPITNFRIVFLARISGITDFSGY